jgi:hypothetical protein
MGLGASYGIEAGIEAGMNRSKERMKLLSDLQIISLLPDNIISFNDSVFNEKTNSYVPAFYTQLGVSIPTQKNVWQVTLTVLSSFLCMLSMMAAIVMFILIIISINNSDIFNWRNVSRLRWLGGLLVLCFVFSVIPAAISFYSISQSFSMQGYTMHIQDFISILTLVLGVVSYIVAEIFAIGLRMKEEQELTI